MNIEEIREVIEKQVEYNKAITGHQDYGISLSDSAALYLLAEIDRLKKRLEPIERVWEKWKAIRVNFMLDDELTCDLWQAIKEAKEVK